MHPLATLLILAAVSAVGLAATPGGEVVSIMTSLAIVPFKLKYPLVNIASLFRRPTLTLASCPLQKATLTTSCSSWPVRQKGSGREVNRIPLPNDVKQSKLLVRLTNARCSSLLI